MSAARQRWSCQSLTSRFSASWLSGLRSMDEPRTQRVLAWRIPILFIRFRRFSCFSSRQASLTLSTCSTKPQTSVSLNRSKQSSISASEASTARCLGECVSFHLRLTWWSRRGKSSFLLLMRRSMSFLRSVTSLNTSSRMISRSRWRALSLVLSWRASRPRKSQLWGLLTRSQQLVQLRQMVPLRMAFLLWLRMATRQSTSWKVPKSCDTTSSLVQVMSMGTSTYSRPRLVRKNCPSRHSSPPLNFSEFMAVSMLRRLGGWMAEPSTSPGSAKTSFFSPSWSSLMRRMRRSRLERWISGVEQSSSLVQKSFSRRRMMVPWQTRPVLPARCLQLALLAQTSSRFSILLRMSKRTSLERQKSITYSTPITVIELSAMLVEMITLCREPVPSSSRSVICSFRIVECTFISSNSFSHREAVKCRRICSFRFSISPSPGMKISTEAFRLLSSHRRTISSITRHVLSYSYLCVLGYFQLKMTEPHLLLRTPLGRKFWRVSRQWKVRVYLPGSVTLMAGQGWRAFMKARLLAAQILSSSLLSLSWWQSSSSIFCWRCSALRRMTFLQKFSWVRRESMWSWAKQYLKSSLSMVALMRTTLTRGCWRMMRFMVRRMKSVSMSRSWTSSRMMKGYSLKKSVLCTSRCRKMPLVTNTMWSDPEMWDFIPIWQPIRCFSRICRSRICCRLTTAILRGCTHMILAFWLVLLRYSQISRGTWVDLPHPVSPVTSTNWFLMIASIIASFFRKMGSSFIGDGTRRSMSSFGHFGYTNHCSSTGYSNTSTYNLSEGHRGRQSRETAVGCGCSSSFGLILFMIYSRSFSFRFTSKACFFLSCLAQMVLNLTAYSRLSEEEEESTD